MPPPAVVAVFPEISPPLTFTVVTGTTGAAVSACEASLRIWSSVLASSSALIWLADLSL